MGVTPLKRIRVDDDLWAAFGDATEAMGTDRTKVLVAFMRRYVEAMDPGRSADGNHGQRPSHSGP